MYITSNGAEHIYQFWGFLAASPFAQTWHFDIICYFTRIRCSKYFDWARGKWFYEKFPISYDDPSILNSKVLPNSKDVTA